MTDAEEAALSADESFSDVARLIIYGKWTRTVPRTNPGRFAIGKRPDS